MNRDDFYVSLPSNVSMKTFPKNKQSNFTTLLEEPIFLPLNFQVALVEISNFSDFKVQMGKISFKNPFFGSLYENRDEYIDFSLSIENGISLKDFCEKLNYEIQNNFIKTEYMLRHKIAHNFDKKFTQAMHVTNTTKVSHKRPILNILKISNKRFVVNDILESSFSLIFYECGGIFDYNLSQFVFRNLDILEKKFNLIILNVPLRDEIISNTYFIDKKSLFLGDQYLINTSSKPNDRDKIIIISEIDTENIDLASTENEGETHNLLNVIWDAIPLVKQLDNNTITFEVKNRMIFEGLISKVLNNNDKAITILNFAEVFNLPSTLQLIKYILVYTDIIESQYYGDVRASILRTVNIKHNKSENVTFFDNPHYLNVSKTRIDTINIEICDINGNHIEFKDLFSNIYISLHFKHKKQ